jgi:hypothetical protein
MHTALRFPETLQSAKRFVVDKQLRGKRLAADEPRRRREREAVEHDLARIGRSLVGSTPLECREPSRRCHDP